MSKIDYSQFYIKNYLPDKKTKISHNPQPKDIKKYKRSKKGVVLFIIALIIISVLVYANFMVDNLSFETFNSWFKKDINTTYYLVNKSFHDRDQAYAQSLLVRQSGAAGYIYKENEKYIVVYTAFTDEKDALNVAKKNDATEVTTKSFTAKNDFYDCVTQALNELISACEQLENGQIYEAKLLEITSIIKTQLTTQKEKYINQTDHMKYVNILDLFIGGLSSLNFPSPTRVSLLSDLRYIISSVIISCCEQDKD